MGRVGEELVGPWVCTKRPNPSGVEVAGQRSFFRQAAAELRASPERSEWRTGWRINVTYVNPSLVWWLWVPAREFSFRSVASRKDGDGLEGKA